MVTNTVVYKDLDFTFAKHPVTKDVSVLKGDVAVKRAIINLVRTNYGEIPFHPEQGCGINRSFFELIDGISSVEVKRRIEDCIKNYEPRGILQNISVIPDPDNNGFNIKIEYRIKNQQNITKVDFFLERIR